MLYQVLTDSTENLKAILDAYMLDGVFTIFRWSFGSLLKHLHTGICCTCYLHGHLSTYFLKPFDSIVHTQYLKGS